MKIFLTFGQDHIHEHEGQILNKDTVVIFEGFKHEQEARRKAFELFSDQFGTTYTQEIWEANDYGRFFPGDRIVITKTT